MEIVEATVDELLDLIKETVWSGEEVKFREFGKFYLKRGAPRKGRNPKTGKVMEIPERVFPAFKVGKGFKNYGNRRK